MKTKGTFKPFLAMLLIFSVIMFMPLASSLGEKTEFDKDKPIKGQIDIVDNWGLPFISTKKATYLITDWTDQCVQDCYGEFLIALEQTDKIFDGMKFKDKKGEERNNNFNVYLIEENGEEYQVQLYEAVCNDVWIEGNETNSTEGYYQEQCVQVENGYETKYRESKTLYDYSPLKAGIYKARLEVKKDAMSSIDAIPIAQGIDLEEWAWFNASWEYKRELTNITDSFITYFNITYDSDMQSDFDDIRFLNGAEDTELNYTLEEKVDGEWADFRVGTNNESSIYMYYGNDDATYNGDFNDTYFDPDAYYYMDEVSGDIIDWANDFDGTNTGADYGATGVIRDALSFVNGDNINLGTALADGYSAGTFGGWIKVDNWQDNTDGWWVYKETGDGNTGPCWGVSLGGYLSSSDGGHFITSICDGATRRTLYSSTDRDTGVWYYVMTVFDGTNVKLYVDNIEIDSELFSGTLYTNAEDLRLGEGSKFSGDMEEFGFWDYALSLDELEYLYYTTQPTGFLGAEESIAGISTALNSPADAFETATSEVTFNCSAVATGGLEVDNMTLYVWGDSDFTNFTDTSGTSATSTWTNTLSDGIWTWNCLSVADDSQEDWGTSNRTLTVDTTPNIQFETPTQIDNYNSSISWIPINVSVTETYFKNITFNGYDQDSSFTYVYTYTDSTRFENITDAYDGTWEYNVTVCTTTNKCNTTETRTINLDTTAPNITIILPTNNTIINGGSVDINFTATDGGIGIDSCWAHLSNPITWKRISAGDRFIHNYFGTSNWVYFTIDLLGGYRGYNISIPTECRINGTITSGYNETDLYCWNGTTNISILHEDIHLGAHIIYYDVLNCSQSNFTASGNLIGDASMIIYANDTVGNIGSSSIVNFTIVNVSTSSGFNALTVEGSYETYYNVINASDTVSVTGVLYYNGTGYDMTNVSSNFSYSLLLPLNTNYTEIRPVIFSQNFTFNGVSEVFNTTSANQTVKKVDFNVTTSCPSGMTPAFNFTFADEQNLSVQNATSISYNLIYGLTGVNTSTYTIYGSVADTNILQICINESDSGLSVSYGEIQYQIAGDVLRRYYLFDGTAFTNDTIATVLYGLTDYPVATAFQITAQTTTLAVYDDHYLSLLRWYPDLNEYKIVEMGKTDEKGQSVLNAQTNDVDYRIGIYQTSGTLVQLIDPIRMVCQVLPCTYTIYVSSSVVDPTVWTAIQQSLEFNATTSVFTFIWNDPSQDTSLINLTVWADTFSTSTLVCSETSTSFTGVLACNVSGESGILRAEAWRSASPPNLLAQNIQTLKTYFTSTSEGKSLGLILGAILVVFFAFMGIFSPVTMIILSVVALIPLVFLGNITYLIFGGFVIIAFICLHFLKRIT